VLDEIEFSLYLSDATELQLQLATVLFNLRFKGAQSARFGGRAGAEYRLTATSALSHQGWAILLRGSVERKSVPTLGLARALPWLPFTGVISGELVGGAADVLAFGKQFLRQLAKCSALLQHAIRAVDQLAAGLLRIAHPFQSMPNRESAAWVVLGQFEPHQKWGSI
jgi:hypothetical protein